MVPGLEEHITEDGELEIISDHVHVSVTIYLLSLLMIQYNYV